MLKKPIALLYLVGINKPQYFAGLQKRRDENGHHWQPLQVVGSHSFLRNSLTLQIRPGKQEGYSKNLYTQCWQIFIFFFLLDIGFCTPLVIVTTFHHLVEVL